MKAFIPKKLEHVVFGLLLTWFMTFLVSGIATILAVGIAAPNLFTLWFKAWMSSWAVAFPSVLVVAPLVRFILRRIVIQN